MLKLSYKTRLLFVFLTVFIVFSLLLARLAWFQLFKSSYLSKLAKDQHNIIVQLDSKRGSIYDRNMRPLAVNLKAASVYVMPSEIEDKAEAVRNLARILSMDEKSVMERFGKESSFVWLKRKIDLEHALEIADLDLKGVGLVKETKRYYPNGYSASHVLGFVGVDDMGLEGIEAEFDGYLRGNPGWSWTVRDAKSRHIQSKRSKLIQPCDGYDLVLTIDEIIQHIAEKELEWTVKKFNAKGGSVIVMNPANGDILALANRPTFNLNNFAVSDTDSRRNRVVTDIFEPGSVFKVVTAGAALESGAVDLEDTFFCEEGAYKVAGHILHDHRPHGKLTFREVIEVSSNIGTVKAAERLGKNEIFKFIKSFGFGSRTNIELPGEVRGIVRPPKEWSGISITAVPIGQEVAVTSIQLISALSAVANGGMLMKPRIIMEMRDREGGVVKSYEPRALRRVISEPTSSLMKEVLEGVVERGTGKRARLSEYRACGKTGTAQKIETGGKYSHSKFIASFMGFAPADNPRIAILISLDEPGPVYYGGSVAAPAFKKIAEDVLRYLKIEPDREGEEWTHKT